MTNVQSNIARENEFNCQHSNLVIKYQFFGKQKNIYFYWKTILIINFYWSYYFNPNVSQQLYLINIKHKMVFKVNFFFGKNIYKHFPKILNFNVLKIYF